MTADAILAPEQAIATNPATLVMSSRCGSDKSVTDALRITAACRMQMSNDPMYDVPVNTNHKTCASADHQHRTCAVQPALLIKGTMSTTDEEVRDAETQAADDEVSNGPDEGLALRLSDTLYRVLRQGLVRTEVDLSPLRWKGRLDKTSNDDA